MPLKPKLRSRSLFIIFTPMKYFPLLLLSFLLASCTVAKPVALTGTKSEKVDKLLELTNQAGAFVKSVEQQIEAQKNSPIAAQVPPGFFDAFLERVRTSGYSDLLPAFKKAYMDTFTEAEIDHLLRYQMDPMTQSMLEKQTDLVLKTTEVGRKYGEKVGTEVATELMMKQNR